MARQQQDLRIETSCRFGEDPRADQGTRRITLAPDLIQIDRSLNGMKMRIQVPAKAYFGVVLISRETEDTEFYELRLAHRDPELSVFLGTADNHDDATALCRQWADFFHQRSIKTNVNHGAANDLKVTLSKPRRRSMTQVEKRRPRRYARRKPGNRENLAIVRRGEREIICYE